MNTTPFIPVGDSHLRTINGMKIYRKRFRQRCAIKWPLSVLMISFYACGTVQVYKEPDTPIFHSAASNLQYTESTDSLCVISFNIKKAEKVELASLELQKFQETKTIDVCLLQEMDEEGVELLAKKLGLNYLYIPIVYDPSSEKNIGNAILTKGSIACPEKLLLPHEKWLSKGRRHATIAEVTIHGKKILVYSVHTETVVMSRKKRMDQVDKIISYAKMQLPAYQYVLIGGDFNTLLAKDAQQAVDKFNDEGFDWSTATVGSTATAFFGLLKPRHDFIFSKGLKVMNAGKIDGSRSSDHYPIVATFQY